MMTGLDTNVIVRFLMKDDAEQAALASTVLVKLTAAEPGFVCREVLVELVWVLQKIYRLPRTDIADGIRAQSAIPWSAPAAESQAFVAKEIAHWTQVIRAEKITAPT